jgi:HD superfamily phosphodiesterase
MLTDEQFRHLCTFVRQYLEETAARSEQEWVRHFPRTAEHRWRHTLNVLRNAEEILAGEVAADDVADVVRVAAVLHDVSMFICDHSIHGRVSADIAEKYLREQGYPEEFVDRVARAIAEHGTDFGPLPPEEQGALFSWEGRVVVEADILDKLGASAIASGLLYLGNQEKLAHECRTALVEGLTMRRAAFFKDYLWTETSKRLAEERFGFFVQFLEQLADEVVESEEWIEEMERFRT